MKDIILYGSGGMASEVIALIEDINAVEPKWHIKGYVDDLPENREKVVNGYKVLGTGQLLKEVEPSTHVVLAMSDPAVKEKIFESIRGYNLVFPVLIHPTARISRSAVIGEGSIIAMDAIVSVNVTIGKHVFVNMRSIIGHDVVIGDFTSCLLNSILCGNVTVNEGVLLGSNCVIMQKKTIGKKAKVSMGSVVSFDVEEGHVVLTRPSKSMYFGE